VSDSAQIARLISFGFVVALVVYVVAGTSNPRYGLPAAVLVAPMAGYFASAFVRGAMNDFEIKWARTVVLGSPAILVALLFMGVAVQQFIYEPASVARSTRPVGESIAKRVAHDAELWSAEILNAKPELFCYARRSARSRGITLRPLWLSRKINALELPPPGTYLVLSQRELRGYESARPGQWRTLETGKADREDYVLVEFIGN
jgi:hypothetical protein